MFDDGTLLLRRGEVERLLNIEACIDAVENIFRLQGEGPGPIRLWPRFAAAVSRRRRSFARCAQFFRSGKSTPSI